MKIYTVSVSQVYCADIEIEAASVEDARVEAMRYRFSEDELCEGHRDTREVNCIEEQKDEDDE